MFGLNPKPVRRYDFGDGLGACKAFGSAVRTIERNGRSGVNVTGIRGRVSVPQHTLNEPTGTVAMWVMSLDDLHPWVHHPQHAASNKYFDRYVLLSDREAISDTEAAGFSLAYTTYWHPVFIAKFAQGTWDDQVWQPTRGAVVGCNYFEFRRLTWYHVVVSWNRAKKDYRVYANGILIGTHDTTHEGPLRHDTAGPILYFGNPTLVHSSIEFHDRQLTAAEVKSIFESQAVKPDAALQTAMRRQFEGEGLPRLDFSPGRDWTPRLELDLRRPEQIEQFVYQGGYAIQSTGEGLHVRTPGMEDYFARRKVSTSDGRENDPTRMYLWTRETFEGDLYVRFRFQLKDHGGLMLLMTQATGMQREDFLNDYPLRTNGSMNVVCWEDVRNYHWELYREMCDVRNDLVSHACLKNPWYKPMNFQIENRRWEVARWYEVEYLQEGNRIRGAIDGVCVMNVTDTPADNNGPVFLSGHVAIRCMMRTNLVLRDLAIYSRSGWSTRAGNMLNP